MEDFRRCIVESETNSSRDKKSYFKAMDFEGVKRFDTLKVFQVKFGSLVRASIKVPGSQADATDMLVSLFVIISQAKPSKGRNHIALK